MPKLEFEDIVNMIYSEDDYDYSDSSKFKHQAKECPVCHKIFYPEAKSFSLQKFCRRSHYINCVVCGKPVLQKTLSVTSNGLKAACPGVCSNKFRAIQTKAAVLDKYGFENISQSSEFKEKISNGLKAVSAQTTAKIQATMKEKYGGMGTAAPELRKKIEATMQDKYGVANPDQLPEFRQKIREKLKSEEVIEKKKVSSRAKYGTDYPTQSEEVQKIMSETLLERYGVPYSGQIPESREKAAQTCIERYGVPNALLFPESLEKARQSMLENQTGRVSQVNLRFIDRLKEEGFDPYSEFCICRKYFDCALMDLKVIIEIDPSYTHSALPNHWSPEGKDAYYHLERTRIAEEAGYRCIHVFDWDSWDKIIAVLKTSETIYARKCILQEIDEVSASKFINEYHIQGRVNGTKRAYALFYKGEMVEVMTFGKARYNRNYQWELLRLCTKTGYNVVGGASKIFKQFLQDEKPESIISYCDLAKFRGQVYTQLGFTLDHKSNPAKIWSKGSEYVTDNLLRQRGYDQLFNTNYGKGTSNEKLMVQHRWLPVYDCGQAVFVWKKGD